MKRRITAIHLGLLLTGLFVVGLALAGRQGGGRESIVPSAQAKDEGGGGGGCPGNCSLHSLKGCYGSTITGTILGGPEAGPVTGVVLQKFDGEGGFTQVDVVSINGTLITPPTGRSSTGTYTVNPDCTGTAVINPTLPGAPSLQLSFVLTDNGRELRSVVTNPGFAATSVGTRQ